MDPWRPVSKALITHAHADHARAGHGTYICTFQTAQILAHRLGCRHKIFEVEYGESLPINSTTVSFHPAGHVLGSAQIRIEGSEETWCVTGDFKRDRDPSCAEFEPVQCDKLIMEATFALPIYQWKPSKEVAQQIFTWWKSYGGPSLLFCYSFGKAQRLLAELGCLTNEEILLHGAVQDITEVYRNLGVKMPPTAKVGAKNQTCKDYSGRLILAPPSAHRSSWMKRFELPQTAFASGWMLVRGQKRRRGYERGFVLSDHADWNSLIQTVKESGAHTVYTTHGQSEVLARYLREEIGVNAQTLETHFEGESES